MQKKGGWYTMPSYCHSADYVYSILNVTKNGLLQRMLGLEPRA
jgi:hypothetical protein